MPAPAPQGGGGQGDQSYDILWIMAGIAVVCAVVWFVFRVQIVTFYLTIKIYELDALNYLGNLFNHPYYFESLRQTLINSRESAKNIGYMQLLDQGSAVGMLLRLPLIVLLVACGIIVYISNSTRSYKRTYKMVDFVKMESQNWPQIMPVSNLELIKTDIDTGPWAMAMTPMQFCKKYKLLEEVRVARTEGMTRKEWDKIEVVLKRGEANKLFALQLGPLWGGSERLPPYARALFAAFAARINADSKPAATLLRQLAESSLNKTLNYKGVDELLKKHENTKLVLEVVRGHAYASTVMAAMLLAARDDGVQACADFLWLKPMDRRLWYTLNVVGRQTPFIEVAGIFAHWIAERDAGRKLMVPMVEEATNAVVIALKEVIYKPDEK